MLTRNPLRRKASRFLALALSVMLAFPAVPAAAGAVLPEQKDKVTDMTEETYTSASEIEAAAAPLPEDPGTEEEDQADAGEEDSLNGIPDADSTVPETAIQKADPADSETGMQDANPVDSGAGMQDANPVDSNTDTQDSDPADPETGIQTTDREPVDPAAVNTDDAADWEQTSETDDPNAADTGDAETPDPGQQDAAPSDTDPTSPSGTDPAAAAGAEIITDVASGQEVSSAAAFSGPYDSTITDLRFDVDREPVELGLKGRKTARLNVSVSYSDPDAASKEPYIFKSKDESIVKVSDTGVVTAVHEGSARIEVWTESVIDSGSGDCSDYVLIDVHPYCYNVKFDLNGGKVPAGDEYHKQFFEEEQYVTEEPFYLPYSDAAEKSGYGLVGWTTKKNGTDILTGEYTTTKDVTLYASWEKQYTLKYNANGGKIVDETYKYPEKVTAGESVYLPFGNEIATKKGYCHDGWTLKKNGKTILPEDYTPTKNVTLYAHYVKAVSITYKAGEGYFYVNGKKLKKITRAVPKGSSAGEHMEIPNLLNDTTGTSFEGWYEDSKLKKPVKRSRTLSKNRTFYAKWDSETYKITVKNLKGSSYTDRATGEFVENAKSKSYSFYVRKGDGIGFIDAYKDDEPARFYFDKACRKKPYYEEFVPSGDTTVYAKWYGEVTVSWDGNGGKDEYNASSGEASVQKGMMCENLPYIMYRKGYCFAGWVDAKKPKKVLSRSHVYDADTTVKAKWVKGVKITFKAGKGTFYGTTPTVAYARKKKTLESSQVTAPYVTRDGYELKGWKNSVTKKVVTDILAEKPKKATTYTAVWKKESKSATVSVTLMAGDGSLENYETGRYVKKDVISVPKNITYEDALTRLSWSVHDDPSKNLECVGWSLRKNGTTLKSSYKFRKNVTLYPVWEEKSTIHIALISNGGAIRGDAINSPYILTAVSPGVASTLPSADEMEREGYTFAGWYKDYACKKKVSKPSAFKTSKTCYLYAKWTKK